MDLVYWCSHHFAAAVADVFFRGEVTGMENLPSQGPYLVAANHCSHLDPPLLGGRIPHRISFFARKTLWKPGLPSWWLTRVGTIPVDRDSADIAAMRRTIGALERGGIVILFPEGTRSPDGRLQPAKAGVGMIACKTRVSVVPVRIFGSFEAFGRGARIPRPHPLSITLGRPLPPALYDAPGEGKRRYQIASERIMAAVAALREPDYPAI